MDSALEIIRTCKNSRTCFECPYLKKCGDDLSHCEFMFELHTQRPSKYYSLKRFKKDLVKGRLNNL